MKLAFCCQFFSMHLHGAILCNHKTYGFLIDDVQYVLLLSTLSIYHCRYVTFRFNHSFHTAAVKWNRGVFTTTNALLISLRGKWAFGLTHCMLIHRKLIGMSWLYPSRLYSEAQHTAFFQVFCLAVD